MKSNLLVKLSAALCMLISFSSCNNDPKETPPTVEDVIAEYSASNLNAVIEGGSTEISKDAKVEIATGDADNKVTITLHNIVPGAPEVEIPNAEFSSATKSFVSIVRGEIDENVTGYNVKVEGTIENKVLSVNIKLTEIIGENTNTTPLHIMGYKGTMKIKVGEGAPIPVDQRIYIEKSLSEGMKDLDSSMVKLTIKNFAFQDMELGNITFDTVLVKKRGDVFAFKGVGRKLTFNGIGEVTADFKGTIVGSEINLDLAIDAAGLKVAVAFEGDASLEFTFDEWVTPKNAAYTEPKGWATSNSAAVLIKAVYGVNMPTPVVEIKDDVAAKITTSKTVSTTNPGTLLPGMTAGTLFLGAFKIDMDSTLKSTHFGVPFLLKPTSFKVNYKYTPGATFYKTVVKKITVDGKEMNANDVEVVSNETDKCSISAYLYEVASYDETLNGQNINTSDKVILKAVLVDGSTNDIYKEQTIQFASTGKGTFDATKKYKLAVVCSSSKRGDEFMGADGSQLFVQKIVIE